MREKVLTCFILCLMAMVLVGCDKGKSAPDSNQDNVDTFDLPSVPDFPSADTLTSEEIARSEKTLLDSVKRDKRVSDDPYAMPSEPDPVAAPPVVKKTGKMVYANAVEGYVNIRKEPMVKSEALGRLYQGGKGLKYLGTQDEWYKVEYKGSTAYVKRVYATFDSLPPKPKTESKPKTDSKPAEKKPAQ